MKKLLSYIKDFFFVEVEEEIEEVVTINKNLISEIERVLAYKDLVDLLDNRVVHVYLLETYSSEFMDLFNISELSNSRHSVSVGNYFDKTGGRIYDHLRKLITYIEGDKLSFKAEEDIMEIVRMFDFYLGE